MDHLHGDEYTILRCTGCGFTFLDPAVNADRDHYDASGYYSPRPPLLSGPIDLAAGLFSRLRLRVVQRVWRRPPARLLDVGCGKGRFLAHARAAGWDCVGIEPTERSWRVAVTKYGLDVISEPMRADHFDAQRFDVVTMWHTLEHIARPVWVMECVFRWLAPGGLAVVAVPNCASWQARIGGSRWLHLDPPRHVSHFTPATARRLVDECGLVGVRIGFFYPELNDLGMIQTALNKMGLSPNFLFNLLKRNQGGLPRERARLVLNALGTLAALAVSGPMLFLATRLEELAGHGGTLVMTAWRPANPSA